MKCIISCAVDGKRRPYQQLLQSQRASHQEFCPEITRIDWLGCYPPGARPHAESFYGFKVFAFNEAFRQGYDSVLWLDSCISFKRHPKQVFDLIERDGYYILSGGATAPLVASIRPDLKGDVELPEDWPITSGQIIGFKPGPIFDEWAEMERKNYFNEEGTPSHRHDEACLSLILFKRKLPLTAWAESAHYQFSDPVYDSYWRTHDPNL